MQSKEINIPYVEYDHHDNPGSEVEAGIRQAYMAADHAYAPFSGFQVGVVIELVNGLTFTANNQENKAYPSGLCAERVGLFYVQANYPDIPIRRMILVAKQRGIPTEEPVFPCGACRQVMVESTERQQEPFEIWMAGSKRIVKVASADYFLPLKFLF